MKFDYVIGNPPYQSDVKNEGDRANPVYDKFIDAAYDISDIVELIHPARFLFEAGQTPKEWNRKMLDDKHLKVLHYESDSSKIFSNVEIKGGIAITLHNKETVFGEIGTFTAYNELNSIVRKVNKLEQNNPRLDSIIASQGLYRFSNAFFAEYPDAQSVMGKGTGNKIVSSTMSKLPDIFVEKAKGEPGDIRFLGRVAGKRAYRYIKREYLVENPYIDSYNLFIPEANNSGAYGETLTLPTIAYPQDGSADTFLSAGIFKTIVEPQNFILYMRTKFFRALLGVRKVTQHCPPTVWKAVPLQDFTANSDIDWSQSVADIDQQLYKKYNLSAE